MKPSELRSKMSEQLLERRNESLSTNASGVKFGSIINPEVDVEEWWCKEGKHLIDILPYIAGKNNPEKKIKEGSLSDHATYYVHKNVGANDSMVICPSFNFGDPCPICEKSKELRGEGAAEEVWKALKPKRMTVYNIIVYDDPKEEAKGVQVWVVAHWNMERHLNVLAQKPRGGGKILFTHPDQGKSISFERAGSGKDNTQYLGHNFQEREVDGQPYVIDDELLDSTYCLEEIVQVYDYDEIVNLFYGKSTKKEETVADPVVEQPTGRLRRGAVTKPVEKEPDPDPGPEVLDDPECFGLETDKLSECNECTIYDDCYTRSEEIKEEENKKVAEAKKAEAAVPAGRKSLRSRVGRK